MQPITRDMCVYFAYLNQPLRVQLAQAGFAYNNDCPRGKSHEVWQQRHRRWKVWMGVVDMGRGLSDTPVLGGCGWVDHVR